VAVTTTIYVKSIGWNSLTWDTSTGGPLAVRIMHPARAIADRTGDSLYPTFVAMVDGELRVSASLRQLKWTIALGTKSDMILTVEGKGGATSTITLPGLVYEGVSMSQDRATVGGAEHTWVHESADGTTLPVS